MTLTRVLPAVAVLLFTNACKDLLVPDYNNSSLEDLTNSPTPTKIRQASQGLLVGTRAGIGEQNGYISLLGIVGRESYNFDPADPRFVTEMLIGPLDGGSLPSAETCSQTRIGTFATRTFCSAVDQVTGMSDAEKSAVRGFAKTIQALDYLNVINTRDDLGVHSTSISDPRMFLRLSLRRQRYSLRSRRFSMTPLRRSTLEDPRFRSHSVRASPTSTPRPRSHSSIDLSRRASRRIVGIMPRC